MNITIFGASGAVGQLVMKEALEKGDFVTAYVRRAGSLKLTSENLRIVVGELTDQALVEKTLQTRMSLSALSDPLLIHLES